MGTRPLLQGSPQFSGVEVAEMEHSKSVDRVAMPVAA